MRASTVPIRHAFICWALVHIVLIVFVSAHETFRVIANGLTIVPTRFGAAARTAETITSAALAESLPHKNVVRQLLLAYLHVAGIEGGYGFFAPNFGDSYQVVFEINYPDGRTETQLLGGFSPAASVRLASSTDRIGSESSEILREAFARLLVRDEFRKHRDADRIRVLIGPLNIPDAKNPATKQRTAFEPFASYNYRPTPDGPRPE